MGENARKEVLRINLNRKLLAKKLKTSSRKLGYTIKQSLAKLLGIYYTQIGRYEKKGAQPSADILSKLANSLGVSSDFLINGTSDDLAESSLTDKELLNQFKAIEKMPERDKDVVKTLIDAFITKGKLKQLVL